MVADQLYDTLEKRGLERIDAEGEEFDPRIHNAVETQQHEDENKVLEQKNPDISTEKKSYKTCRRCGFRKNSPEPE